MSRIAGATIGTTAGQRKIGDRSTSRSSVTAPGRNPGKHDASGLAVAR